MNLQNYYFRGDTIRLRGWESKDYGDAYEMEYDSECMAYLKEEISIPNQKIDEISFNEITDYDTAKLDFVITNNTNEYLGHIRFNHINERHGTFSLGIVLKECERGKGYGKEAMNILLKYAFEERRLHKFQGYCVDVNLPSIGMFETLGCIREGIDHECIYMHGQYHDRFMYGMTYNDYKNRKMQSNYVKYS